MRQFMGKKGCIAVIFGMLVIGGSLAMFMRLRSVKPEEVPGRYVAKWKWGRELLDIRSDGTFEQVVIAGGRQVMRNEGTWEYYENTGHICLDDLVVCDKFGEPSSVKASPENKKSSGFPMEHSILGTPRIWRYAKPAYIKGN